MLQSDIVERIEKAMPNLFLRMLGMVWQGKKIRPDSCADLPWCHTSGNGGFFMFTSYYGAVRMK